MPKYIVNGTNGAMEINPEWVPEGRRSGVLCYGDQVTVFNSYSSARRAIIRTEEYADQQDFELFWKTYELRAMRLNFNQ